jgi:PAS domain S-box-containing protein
MRAARAQSISATVVTWFLVVILLLAVSLGGAGLWTAWKHGREDMRELRERVMNERRHRLVRQVDDALRFIDYKRSQAEVQGRETLRQRVGEAHAIAQGLVERYADTLSTAELEDLVTEALRPIRFNQGRGYFFATRLDGVEKLFSDRPELEGENLLDMVDTDGTFVIREMIDLVQREGSGFVSYRWTRPGHEGNDHEKISYVRLFEPFGWFLGTGEYTAEMTRRMQEEACAWIANAAQDPYSYVFALDSECRPLVHPSTELIGTDVSGYRDSSGRRVLRELLDLGLQGGGFLEYLWPRPDSGEEGAKLSYVAPFEPWGWVVGSGVHLRDIDEAVAERTASLRLQMAGALLRFVAFACLSISAAAAIGAAVSRRLRSQVEIFEGFFRATVDEWRAIPVDRLRFRELRRLADAANRMAAEQRRTQEQLRLRELQYHTLFDVATDAFVLIDHQGTVRDANPAGCALFGYSREALLGMAGLDLLHPDSREPVARAFEATFSSGQGRLLSCTYLRKAGAAGSLEIHTALVPHDPGPWGLAIARDVTRRLETERRLRTVSERFSRFADEFPGGAWILDRDHRVVFANRFVRDLMETDAVEGAALHEILGAPGRESEAHDGLAFEQGSLTRESILEDRHGTQRRFRTVRFTIPQEGGDPLLGGIAVETTEQARMQDETRRLRAFLQSIIDSLPAILVVVDIDGRVRHWNQRAAAETGVSDCEAIGQSVFELIPVIGEYVELVRTALGEGRVQRCERAGWEREDRQGYYRIVVYPVSDSDRGQLGVILLEDTTPQVLVERMMVQNEKMLSLGGLAAGMAHEINNPLAGVLQGLQVIEDQVDPGLEVNREAAARHGIALNELRAYLEDRGVFAFLEAVRASGERAAGIVENMLRFTRQTEIQAMELCDLDLLVTQTLDLAVNEYDVKREYDLRRIAVEREVQPGLPLVPCIRGEIQQVLLNILRNAAQALLSVPGGVRDPRIGIRLFSESGYAGIEISDNGPGIPAATLERVFEPFYTTKPVGVGTGLGLSVSYFIVTNNHHGMLSAESEPGQRTTFTVRLPLA